MIEPSFSDEFRVDDDPRVVALDFFSYINARQANLGWNERDDRIWRYLEDALDDLRPLLFKDVEDSVRGLRSVVSRWAKEAPRGEGFHHASELRQVRGELSTMLENALVNR